MSRKMIQRMFLLVLVFSIFVSNFSVAFAQDAIDPEEEVFQPVLAELPVSVGRSTGGTKECFWAYPSPLDEDHRDGIYLSGFESQRVSDAYSGEVEWRAMTNSVAIPSLTVYSTLPHKIITDVFVRVHYRGQVASSANLIITNTDDRGGATRRYEISGAQIFSGWQRWESLLPNPEELAGNQVMLDVRLVGSGGSDLRVDQIGIGYCTNEEDIDEIEPTITDVASISDLAAVMLPNRYFGGELVNHGTNAATVRLAPNGLQSFEECFKDPNCRGQVFTRNFLPGRNPFGVTEGQYLGDKLWVTRNIDIARTYAERCVGSREFSESACLEAIQKSQHILNSLANNWQLDPVKKAQKIELTQVKLAWDQLRLARWQSMSALEKELFRYEVVLTFEERAYQLSRQFDGGKYSYVLRGQLPWTQLRALYVAKDMPRNLVTELYRAAVRNGAPRSISIIQGDRNVYAGLWHQWVGYLRNIAVPSVIFYGGQLWNTTVVAIQSGAAIASEAAAPVAGAAALLVAGDAAYDTYSYSQLKNWETNLSWWEFIVNENLLYRALVEWGGVEYRESQLVFNQFRDLTFCIPQHQIVYQRYSDLIFDYMTHPALCSYQMWRIAEIDDDDQVLWIEKEGTNVRVPLSQESGKSQYSMVLDDPEAGLIVMNFEFWLIEYNYSTQTARLKVGWVDTSPPAEYGQCAGWSPTRPVGQECGTSEVYLPSTQR